MPKLSKITPLTRNEIFLNKIANGGDDVVTGETLNVTVNGKYTPSAENKVITEVNVNVPTSGGDEGDTRTVKVLVKSTTDAYVILANYQMPLLETNTYLGQFTLPGNIITSDLSALQMRVNNNDYAEFKAPADGGIVIQIGNSDTVQEVITSDNAVEIAKNMLYYFTDDGEITVNYGNQE